MKIEDLIVQHLYKNKEVTLQEIGTFKLAPDIIFPQDEEKEFVMPKDAITFEYNIKAGEDGNLINYIVQHTNKIKPLATSDLESYIMLSKQFLNIGKPLLIPGLGTLLKTQQGNYEFLPGGFISPKAAVENVPLREKIEEEISFRSYGKPQKNKNSLWAVLSIVVLILIAVVVWFFWDKNVTEKKDSPAITIAAPILKDTVKTPTNNQALPQETFKVVIKEFPTYAAANKSYTKLSGYGHNLIIYTKDSATFKLAMPFSIPLKDTTIVKDSLKRKLFGGNPYIEM